MLLPSMGWSGIIHSILFFSTMVESSSRSVNISSLNSENGAPLLHDMAITSAGIFVLVAVVLSMFLLFDHLVAYNQPEEQKFLIGLILMVPVYAFESFISILDPKAAFNCEVIRDCYEAFALYCFERYLIACLGGEESTIEFMERQGVITSDSSFLEEAPSCGVVKHPFPLNYLLREWYLGEDFYYSVKIGIVQYMILKTICALVAMILQAFGVYGEGKFQWNYGYPYLAVILNFSQTWALYCLVQFYTATKDKLAPIKPLAKFLTVKSIVFLTWWQGIVIAFLLSMGAFRGSLALELKARIQDYIICIEMGIAAVVHLYVFPAVSYKRGERCVRNVAVMDDYAALGSAPDPEEVLDCGRFTKTRMARHDEMEKRLSFPQSVRDLVLGSGEIIVDDMKFTVSHVVEPVERGFARVNKSLQDISENVKRLDLRKKSKDDTEVLLNSWNKEFSEAHGITSDGSISDSGLASGIRQQTKPRSANSLASRYPPYLFDS